MNYCFLVYLKLDRLRIHVKNIRIIMKITAMIPVRLESSRLPRKALLDICGFPMIYHVYQRCLMSKLIDEVYVATDSNEIARIVKSFDGKVIMTSNKHETGTDRIAEAAKRIGTDVVVNVQGDEALVKPSDIDIVINELIINDDINVCVLVNRFNKYNSPSDIKAVLNEKNQIMYLSRSDIPSNSRTKNPTMFKVYHIVPFRKDFLISYANWEKTNLEKIEYNEYLRILEKGYKINAVEVDSEAVSVDTPSDLEFVRKAMVNDNIFKLYKYLHPNLRIS